jgi:hypothetical protein
MCTYRFVKRLHYFLLFAKAARAIKAISRRRRHVLGIHSGRIEELTEETAPIALALAFIFYSRTPIHARTGNSGEWRWPHYSR